MIRRRGRGKWGMLAGGFALCAVSCSSKVDPGTAVGPTDQMHPGGSANGGGPAACEPFCGQGGGTSTVLGSGGAFGTGDAGAKICVGAAISVEALPVDLYVMFDQSSSMADSLPDNSGTWWGAAQDAVKHFVNDPRAAGMDVGIQYFPLNGVAPASCTASYSTPDVELGMLPGNAAAVSASIDAHQPSAFTPTGPALSGAIEHMKTWAASHPGRAPVVVLVTDGFPTECDPQQVTDVAAIAKAGFETDPPVRTFVVGFNLGKAGENLRAISDAGGSGDPFLITGGDVGAAFTTALLGISDKPLQCNLSIPPPPDPSQKLDPDLVAVRYTSKATGVTQDIVRLNNLGDCDLNRGEGWYYDSPAAPTEIELCKGTCSRLAAGIVETVFGCHAPSGTTR